MPRKVAIRSFAFSSEEAMAEVMEMIEFVKEKRHWPQGIMIQEAMKLLVEKIKLEG